jgi:TPR repeat protein
LAWFRKAADQGYASAQQEIEGMFDNGADVPTDPAQAAVWWRNGANLGNAHAQMELGAIYEMGLLGLPKDDAQAVLWFRKAADQGNADAQESLGEMYSEGRGVPQDYVLAHMWLNLAAASSDVLTHKSATEKRADVAAKMTPDQIAEAQKMAREWVPKSEMSDGSR